MKKDIKNTTSPKSSHKGEDLNSMFFLIFFLSFFIFNNNTYSQNFHGGILGGVTASEISGDQLAGPNKAGPLLGAFVNHTLSENSFLQMEMYYVQKGSRKNPNPDMGDYTKYVLRINYIEMPVIYVWQKYEKLAFEGGLAGALHFSDQELDQNGEIPRPPNGPAFKPFDVSWLMGVAYNISEKTKFDFRYSNSIMAVRDHSGGTTYRLNKGQYNAVWHLSLRYTF